MDDQPLVSLCITCYNQARYIRDAILSAFNQTYSHLEIVISDDCSTDGTDKVIRELVATYKGPHRILFNRNENNLFVCKNYEKAFRLAHGELLITGAGDDISLPNRVERIVAAWLGSGKKASYIAHAFIAIDKDGRELYRGGPWEKQSQLGAVTAYSADIVRLFGDLPSSRDIYEDGVFTLRAFAIGPAISLKDYLCKWRIGSGLSTRDDFRSKRIHISLHQIRSCEIFFAELDKSNVEFKEEYLEEAKKVADWRMRHYTAEYAAVAGKFPWTRFWGLLRLTPNNGWHLEPWIKWVIYGSFVPPFGLGWFVVSAGRLAVRLRLVRFARWMKSILRHVCR